MAFIRYVIVITGIVETLLIGGLTFGWSSLSFVLTKEGYFNSTCNSTGFKLTTNSSRIRLCPKQQADLDLVFTLSTVIPSISNIFVGWITDRLDLWVVRSVAGTIFVIACLLIAFTTTNEGWVIYLSMIIFGISGNGIYLSNISTANLVEKFRSTIVSLSCGAYDASALVFAFVKIAYENGISLMASFCFIACCLILSFLRTFFLLPRLHIPYKVKENFKYDINDCPCKFGAYKDSTTVGDMQSHPAFENQLLLSKTPIERKSFRSCISSFNYILGVFHLAVLQLRNQVFYGTLDPWLKSLTGNNVGEQSRYITAFGIFQLIGFVFSPLIGILIDISHRYYKKFLPQNKAHVRSIALAAAVTTSVSVIFSACTLITILPLQYFTFAMNVTFRTFLYSTFSAFLVSCFPMYHFGKLYGTATLCGGVLSLLQYAFLTIVVDIYHGDFFVINLVLLVLALITFVHPLNLYMK